LFYAELTLGIGDRSHLHEGMWFSEQGVLLAALAAYYHQACSGNKRNGAEDGRDREGAGLFVLNLYGAYVHVFLFVGKADAAHCEAYDAQENKNNSNNCCGFHELPFRADILSFIYVLFFADQRDV
jgi:hypothetical protein